MPGVSAGLSEVPHLCTRFTVEGGAWGRGAPCSPLGYSADLRRLGNTATRARKRVRRVTAVITRVGQGRRGTCTATQLRGNATRGTSRGTGDAPFLHPLLYFYFLRFCGIRLSSYYSVISESFKRFLKNAFIAPRRLRPAAPHRVKTLLSDVGTAALCSFELETRVRTDPHS